MPPSHAASRPIRLSEFALVLATAVLFVAAVDLFTNSMPPRWDSVEYLDMARSGIFGNDHLKAPYAYRPGTPFLARQAAQVFSISIQEGFAWVTRCAAVVFLVFSFLLARNFTASASKALLAMLFAGASAAHVKLPLFVPTSVEAAAFALMVLSVWAHVRGHRRLFFWISAGGLFFKEFLAIPLLLAVREFARAYREHRNLRNRLTLAAATAMALAVVLVPRLGLPIVGTDQEIDPLHRPRSLARLVLNPLDLRRDVNILVSILGYWLPCLLLVTRERLEHVRRKLGPMAGFIGIFLALNFLLVMYGGTNVLIFVSYSVPVQLMILTALLDAGGSPRRLEWVLALACVAVYNRLFSAIPLPEDGFDAFIDFYGGWSSRVNLSTVERILEITLYLGILWGWRRWRRYRAEAVRRGSRI